MALRTVGCIQCKLQGDTKEVGFLFRNVGEAVISEVIDACSRVRSLCAPLVDFMINICVGVCVIVTSSEGE